MLTTRAAARTGRQQLVFDMHRFTSILALAFSLLHVHVLLGDQYFSFSVWQLSLPFASPYRTLPTALGVVSLYAMAIVIASFYVRRFIGYRAWRAVHFVTFAMYAGVTLHGITAGTDTAQTWARLIYVSAGTAVVALRIPHPASLPEDWRWPLDARWRRCRHRDRHGHHRPSRGHPARRASLSRADRHAHVTDWVLPRYLRVTSGRYRR